MVGVAAAGRVTTSDGAVTIAHNAGAAVGHNNEDAVAVIPAPHALQALLRCRVAQPPVSAYRKWNTTFVRYGQAVIGQYDT